jgi:MFS family permease
VGPVDEVASAKGLSVHRYISEIGRFSREMRLYLLYTLLVNIGVGVFILIYNLYLVQISFKEDFIGTFNAVQTVAMGISALIIGLAINRFGSWRCTTYGTIIFLVSTAVLALLTTSSPILVVSAINGAAFAFMTVPVMPFIVEWTTPTQRTTAAAITFSLNSIATTLGSLVGGWSPKILSFMGGMAVESIPAYRFTLLIGIALATTGMLPLWLMRQIRDQENAELAQSSLFVEMPTTTSRTRRDLSVFVLIGVIMSIGSGAVVPFVNVFLESIGSRPSQIGLVFSIAGVVAALTGLLAPAMYRRLGALVSSMIVRMASAPLYLLLAFSPQMGYAVAAQIVRTTSISMAWPIDSSFISDVLPPKARANAFSLRSGAWNLGYALSSVIAGEIIVGRGYQLTFVLYAVTIVLASIINGTYFWRHPGHKRAQRKRQSAAVVSEPAG